MAKEKDCWAWQAKINAEPDPTKREVVYREALQDFPESVELAYNFACFMKYVRKNDDCAEQLYRKALELDSEDTDTLGNLALLLEPQEL